MRWRDLANLCRAERGTDTTFDQAPVLAHGGGGEVIAHHVEPAVEELAERDVARLRSCGVELENQPGQLALRFSLRAAEGAADL